jgi:hypothetical protein
MIRIASCAFFVAVTMIVAERSANAQLPVAPPPREVRPDGTRDPAPAPEALAKAEDPAVVVDRIIKNSKDVGDKLAATDTGKVTRKTQDKILSDIDSLINRQENPPPTANDNKDNKDNPKNNDPKNNDPKNNDSKNNDMKDPSMNKDPMPKDPKMDPGMQQPKDKSMGNMGMENKQDMPMGGMSEQPMGTGRRPRKQPDKSDEKQEKSGQPKDPNDPKNPAGNAGGNPGGKPKVIPSLPLDEDVAKDVWGHLPDKLRQQMTQYYKEDVMPKYSELLRLYYSSLSEKSANPMLPKK